jgi:hypothetical protein
VIAVAARRCPSCKTAWPLKLKQCPECLTHNEYASTATAIPQKDADVRVAHAEFERFYERHDEERVGATPEEIGHLEAQQERRRLRELEAAFQQAQAA